MYTVWGYDETDEWTEFETFARKSEAVRYAKESLFIPGGDWFETKITTVKNGKRTRVWDSQTDFWPFYD